MKTKPIQRVMSVIALMALALTTLVVPAFAAPAASATLTAGTNVFPTGSDATTRNFTVRVNNTAMPVVGETINWVRVVLPASEAGIELKDTSTTGSAPSGWSVTATSFRNLQFLTYQSTGTGAIAPQTSQAFTFPATVARPLNSERTGGFTVATSSNGGQTTANAAGELEATVEIIEVLSGVSAVSPDGVTDGTGTAGQTIDVEYAVKNHAQQAVSVDGTLAVTTNPAAATVASPTITQSVAPYDSATPSTTFTHAVDLETVTADTNVRFQASASTAEVARTSAVFQVQVPSVLSLDASSFGPKVTKTGPGTEAKTFSIDATQLGTPALTLDSGTLVFGGNTADLQAPVAYTGDDDENTLVFETTAEITGPQGPLDGVFTFQTTDANGFQAELSYTLADLIRIDDLAPELTIEVEIPEGQNGVKNGDTIGVSGTIVGLDAVTETLTVTLTPDIGDAIEVSVSTNKTSDGYNFSGSATADFAAPTYDDDEVKIPNNDFAKSFTAQAEVEDTAGNIGSVASPSFLIDNVAPYLKSPGSTGEDGSGASVIEIEFTDFYPTASQLEGGCDPSLYRVDGIPGRVVDVRFEGQTESCQDSATPEDGHNGRRVLVLNYDLEPDETPTVTYLLTDADQARSFGLEPVVDGVVNDAERRTIDTLSGVIPLAPSLEAVERAAGDGQTEPAYQDADQRYWSRTGGNDDITVTFSGFEDGWTIQVTNGQGTSIKSQPLTRDQIEGTDQDAPGESGVRSITIPLPTLSGPTAGLEVARGLRFVSEVGNVGLTLPLDFGLDNVAPTIAAVSNSGTQVTVDFTEDLVAGSNFASDWFGWEDRAGDRRYYTAEEVTNGEGKAQRLVNFGFEDPTLFGGVEYFFTSSGRQYEDRAGNLLTSQEQAA